MPSAPSDRAEMLRLVNGAIDALQRDSDEPIDEEHVSLLVTGQVERIPPAQRQDLLREVARDPELAQLVRDLHALGLSESDDGAERSPVLFSFGRVTTIVWAAAACVLFGLGGWRLIDPPAPIAADGTLQTYQADARMDYWEQLDRQRLIERAEHDRMRDMALLACAAACLVLSVPVVWRVMRRDPASRGC